MIAREKNGTACQKPFPVISAETLGTFFTDFTEATNVIHWWHK